MSLQDLFIDVAAGEEKVNQFGHRSRKIELRASERITVTTEFEVAKVRAQAHMALDAALDELETILDMKKRGTKVNI